ncbi:MAG: dihydropteroate synthase, partial [Calditrichaeota bacterium]|nr:dihydropteroate synthase [Calditrichota bacterium]
EHALEMVDAGADIIDVGGESTRPGAEPVSAQEERRRVVPVIRALRRQSDVLISIDTYKAEVAQAAVDAGADIVNDISGLGFDDGMPEVVAASGAGLVLMHIKGTPRTMQRNPVYGDVIGEISDYFAGRLGKAEEAGISREQVVLDPGIGFGKQLEHNLEILRRLKEFRRLGRPLLVGPSRKSFIGAILDLPPDQRLEGTAAAVALCVAGGADIVRVHDVPEMTRVVRVADAVVRGLSSTAGA